MSKFVSLILILVLFLGSAVNSFAGDRDGEGGNILEGDSLEMIVGMIIVGGLVLWLVIEGVRSLWGKGIFAEAEPPDNGIRTVSTEDETRSANNGKTILNVLQHIETGVTSNKDFYMGLRFRY